VTTFVAVLKKRNLRSAAFLRHLGFVSECPTALTPIGADPDELAMYKAHVGWNSD
jgi:hypothetical protein